MIHLLGEPNNFPISVIISIIRVGFHFSFQVPQLAQMSNCLNGLVM